MKQRVLIIDDEENMLMLVAATLGFDESYHITIARDGQEALEVAQREKPDLVILDMAMPILDGSQVCRDLKANPATAHAKVIVLTALAQDTDKGRAMAAGADRFVTKPFSPTALLDMVEEMLGSNHEEGRDLT